MRKTGKIKTALKNVLTNTLGGYMIRIPDRGIWREYERRKKGLLLWGQDHPAGRGAEEKAVNRLKRLEGQIRGIQAMVEQDAYCNDILIQSAAVNAAINAFNKELLASHIRTCVARDIREGKDEVIDELVTTIQKLMR